MVMRVMLLCTERMLIFSRVRIIGFLMRMVRETIAQANFCQGNIRLICWWVKITSIIIITLVYQRITYCLRFLTVSMLILRMLMRCQGNSIRMRIISGGRLITRSVIIIIPMLMAPPINSLHQQPPTISKTTCWRCTSQDIRVRQRTGHPSTSTYPA
jgi:hypothetical protein